MKAVDEVNEQASTFFIQKIEKTLKSLNNKTIGILGLAFKPNTDDMREAPSIKIINYLRQKNAKIKAYDPIAMTKAEDMNLNINFCQNAYEAAKSCHALVIVTEWNEFRQLDLSKIKEIMAKPIIFDGRNIYDPKKMKKLGFAYYSVGR